MVLHYGMIKTLVIIQEITVNDTKLQNAINLVII